MIRTYTIVVGLLTILSIWIAWNRRHITLFDICYVAGMGAWSGFNFCYLWFVEIRRMK